METNMVMMFGRSASDGYQKRAGTNVGQNRLDLRPKRDLPQEHHHVDDDEDDVDDRRRPSWIVVGEREQGGIMRFARCRLPVGCASRVSRRHDRRNGDRPRPLGAARRAGFGQRFLAVTLGDVSSLSPAEAGSKNFGGSSKTSIPKNPEPASAGHRKRSREIRMIPDRDIRI
jgi:hypothetical protein